MSDTVFRVNAPSVVSEIIDGELVIMNLKSGKYYSSESTGAMIWTLIGQGQSLAVVATVLRSEYDGEANAIEGALGEFTDRLLEEELIQVADRGRPAQATVSTPPPATRGKAPFAPPKLGIYTDMQDLLLLDPIHDVDERGWPTPRPDTTPAPE